MSYKKSKLPAFKFLKWNGARISSQYDKIGVIWSKSFKYTEIGASNHTWLSLKIVFLVAPLTARRRPKKNQMV